MIGESAGSLLSPGAVLLFWPEHLAVAGSESQRQRTEIRPARSSCPRLPPRPARGGLARPLS
jgi:hypothetical protein